MTVAIVKFPQANELLSIEQAKLPPLYESAKKAIAECARIDECKDWADKSAALASYAKQAKNEEMLKHCMRVQARAIERCGELLEQIQPSKGGRPSETQESDSRVLTREQAATDAGLNEHQRKTALRIATVPKSLRDELIDSDDPPTVSELAELGIKKKPLVDLGGIPPEDYARATKAQGTLRRFAEFCDSNEPTRIAKAFMPHELNALRKYVATVDTWLDKFITNLPE